MFRSSCPSDLASRMTTLITSNEEINDIMKIVKSLEESGLLIKGANKTIKNEVKEQKGGFLRMLLNTLDASLLGHLLTVKTEQQQQVKDEVRLELARIFNFASCFN